MAKFRVARKATKGYAKQKRWKKGQSSSSNPNTTKFREQAKRRAFNYNQGAGNLTESALAQHDALQRQTSDNISVDSENESIGCKTFDTFASGWSECSNPSFNRLLKHWNSTSALHKEMLAVLAAVTEVIKSKDGKESETEYFAALMTTLGAVDTDESVTSVVSLLSMVIKSLPPAVLKLKFSEASKIFVTLLGKYVNSDHNALLRGLLGCLSVLLRAQEPAVWSNSSTLQIYNVILSCSIHSKPKVRKAAQHSVCAILKGSALMTGDNPPLFHPAAVATAKFCVQKIEESGGSGTSVLHLLGLLKDILSVFPRKNLKAACEIILRVMTLSSVLVISCSFQALHGLFVSNPKPENLPAELNAQIITALYDYQPSVNDAQLLIGWLTVMREAFINLHRLDQMLCINHLPKLFNAVIPCWLSDKPNVLPVVGKTLEGILLLCVKPSAKEFEAMVQDASNTSTVAHKIFHCLEGALRYQFHAAWKYVLEVLSVTFDILGKECHTVMMQCLQSLADLRDSDRFAYTIELDKVFGAAIKAMGPALVLKAVPLKITGENDRLDFPRSWLLPVLKNNIQESELGYFRRYFLPLAIKLRKKTLELEDNGSQDAKIYSVLQSQIWSLLPGFCTIPKDLVESFKDVAKILGTALNERPDLRLDILTSIRLLINKNLDNEPNKAELSRFAKNFLPILFNLYTTEPKNNTESNARLSAYDTIKTYLQISDELLCVQLFNKAMERLQDPEIIAFSRHALIDLNRALLQYMDEDNVKTFYNYCKPLLQHRDHTIQKKAYLVMEELCKNESKHCRSFVTNNIAELQELLLSALSTSALSSKAPRLRCLGHILSSLTQPNKDFVTAVVPEAILCTKANSEKPRKAAFSFLNEAGKALKLWQPDNPKAAIQEYVHLLMAGLAGNPHLISASILALGSVLYEFRDDISSQLMKQIIENVCLLSTVNSREIVQASLSFMKIIFSGFNPEDVVQLVEFMVKNLVNIAEDSQRHFRFQAKEIFVRLVRKFGYEMISSLVPPSHQKLLTNIRKTEARKSRQKLSKQTEKDNEEELFNTKSKPETIEDLLKDSDDELPLEMEKTNQKKKRQFKKAVRRGTAWIEEKATEIVDFLDSSVNKKVTATKPAEHSKVKHDFKTSADGRLIISEEAEVNSKKNMPSNADDGDSKELAAGKVRKRKLEADSDEEDMSGVPAKYQAGGKGIHRPLAMSQNRKEPPDFGATYRAKKATGDVRMKGRPDPYAYIPLDRKTLNKRKRAKLAGRFKNIVGAARKGARKGVKANLKIRKK